MKSANHKSVKHPTQAFFLHLKDSSVLLTGASGGIGLALSEQLLAATPESCRIVLSCRAASDRLQQLASDDARVTLLDGLDITREASLADSTAAVADIFNSQPLRCVVNAAGLLHNDDVQPERQLADLNESAMQQVFAVNAIGPALLLRYLQPHLPRHGRLLLAMLSARVGSISDNRLGGWYSYRASKAALNQLLKTASIELKRYNSDSICIGLHPGTVDTGLSKPFQSGVPEDKLFSTDRAAHQLWEVMAQRNPDDSGKVFAWDGRPVPA